MSSPGSGLSSGRDAEDWGGGGRPGPGSGLGGGRAGGDGGGGGLGVEMGRSWSEP